jgi:hypothetical protein
MCVLFWISGGGEEGIEANIERVGESIGENRLQQSTGES